MVIRGTTRSTCNTTMLRDKLNETVARITWPLWSLVLELYGISVVYESRALVTLLRKFGSTNNRSNKVAVTPL